MADATATDSVDVPLIRQCVSYARARGLPEPYAERRIEPRHPFSHPIRLRFIDKDGPTGRAYAADINEHGIGLYCLDPVAAGDRIVVELPVADGQVAWVPATVVYAQPTLNFIRAGAQFMVPARQSSPARSDQ
ncbi:MAG: PilZ domain-containing protein [Phycisphaerae bacterium]